ncbi:MAG: hypothetical protein IH905_14000 [Proteobacteria bacterium]|nr:hypothetical protein [Pseudomonadota bacterium]
MNLDDAEFLLGSTDIWWAGDVPTLTPDQHSELEDLVHHAILPKKESWFQDRLDAIFGQTVRSETIVQSVRQRGFIAPPASGKASKRHPKKLSTVVLRELEQISKSAEALAVALESASETARESLAGVCQGWVIERPTTQAPPPDIASFRRALVDLLLKSQLAHGEIKDSVSRGGGEPALRQMVRGLADIYYEATGVLPTRIYRPWRTGNDDRAGETGPFLNLARALAGMANEALPENLRRKRRSSLSNIVREELEALAREIAEKTPKTRQ